MRLFVIIILASILSLSLAKAQDAVDIVLTNNFLGDNIISYFPEVGSVLEQCQKRRPKCKVRLWAPQSIARTFKNPSQGLEVYGFKDDSTASEFVKQFMSERSKGRTIKLMAPDNSHIYGRDIRTHPHTQVSLKNIHGELLKAGEKVFVEEFFRPKGDFEIKNNYDFYNKDYGEYKAAKEGKKPSKKQIEAWRKSIVDMLAPPNADEIVDSTLQKLFPTRKNNPTVLLNLTTGKATTDPFYHEYAEKILKSVVNGAGKDANIIIPHFDDLPYQFDLPQHTAEKALALEAREKFKALVQKILKENPGSIKILPKGEFEIIDSLIGSKKVQSVVSFDTGLYHVASARRVGNLKDSVVGVFRTAAPTVQDIFGGSADNWTAPHSKAVSMIDKELSTDKTSPQKIEDAVNKQVNSRATKALRMENAIDDFKLKFCL
jgi:ADP-heptose:LPS heptosyltransferase